MPEAKLTLELTECRWSLEDGSGYTYNIGTKFEPDVGWSAAVTMKAGGLTNENAAIQKLRAAVAKFLEMTEV